MTAASMEALLRSTLSYGLAPGTTFHDQVNGFYLVLNYPLKFTALHRTWYPLFQELADHPMVPMERIEDIVPDIPVDKIAEFLNQLVYKGFLVRSGNEGLDDFPRVSVIIPVRNRPKEIRRCLTAIAGLGYPAEKIETIVVDDASTDHTPSAIEKFPVRLIRLDRRKQASFCRNEGARGAEGEILAFIDSDCIAHPNWLLELIPAFGEMGLTAVGGLIDTHNPQNRIDQYEKAKSSLMISSYARRSKKEDPFFYVPACNFLIRRKIFLELNGFDVGLSVGEDVDLCWRLQDRGHSLAFRPQGVVFHKHRNRTAAFCKRRFQYGTSEPMLQKMHPKRRKQFLVPPAALATWTALLVWTVNGAFLFLGIACLIVVGDSVIKKQRLSKIPIGLGSIVKAMLRSYGAFGYHLCAFISRYYLFWGLICLPIHFMVTLVVLAMHLLHAGVEFRLKKPSLNIAWFLWFFTLEQLSYQLGVWWACLAHRTLKPVLPKPAFRISIP
jgi:mycofactocin system glycosyltransferase